ncbi:MAG: S1 RNA-binding domain-containing protein, partial [Oscillospiraceae bacterium]|nr:S1 RNA-binding domain-containing protein [Oscillospiraceae bacterium]
MAESTKFNGMVPENEHNGSEQSFEDMLNESFVSLNRGRGERVKGIIRHISGSEIYVDLNGKYTGILSFDEITDDLTADVKEMFKVGDEIETQIIKTNDQEGTALLSRKRIDSNDNWDKIVQFAEEGTTAEGKVVQAVNGGIIILVESVKVFVPASHANVARDTDLQTLMNKQVKVKIIDVNQQKRRVIASIRHAENEERRALGEKVWAELEIGRKYEGIVKSIANYGAFVDIGGVDGMVHITELSWT